MARYHNVLLGTQKPVAYKPMDPREKVERVKRLEARLAGNVTLDENGDLTNYGVLAVKPQPVEDAFSSIDDARLDLSPKLTGLHSKMVYIDEAAHMPEPVIENPVMTQAEFEERLDNLCTQSEAFYKQFMEKFGDKE